MFGYQNILEVIKNGVNPLVKGATIAQSTVHKEEKTKDFKVFVCHSSMCRC